MTDKILEAVKALGGNLSNSFGIVRADCEEVYLCDDGYYLTETRASFNEEGHLFGAKYICTIPEFNTAAAEWLKEAYMHNAAIDLGWKLEENPRVAPTVVSAGICTKEELVAYMNANKPEPHITININFDDYSGIFHLNSENELLETPEEKEAFDMIENKRIASRAIRPKLNGTLSPEEWNGEGLPPVGVECEVIYKYGNNFNITPTYFGDGVMAYIDHRDMEEKVSGSTDIMTFRPIKSPRDKASDALADLLIDSAKPHDYPREHAEYYASRVYDWLKSLTPEQKKEFGL